MKQGGGPIIQWEWLARMLEQRIRDGAFLNPIRKWLRAGRLEEDGKVIHPRTSPVRENRPPGSVRGARGNPCPYLDNGE